MKQAVQQALRSVNGWKTYAGAALIAFVALNSQFGWINPDAADAIWQLGIAAGVVGIGHKIAKLHGAITDATSDDDDDEPPNIRRIAAA